MRLLAVSQAPRRVLGYAVQAKVREGEHGLRTALSAELDVLAGAAAHDSRWLRAVYPTNGYILCSKRRLACACVLPGIPSVLHSTSSELWPKAVYAPRGAKFYELALVASAFARANHDRKRSSAYNAWHPKQEVATRESKSVLHEAHAYER